MRISTSPVRSNGVFFIVVGSLILPAVIASHPVGAKRRRMTGSAKQSSFFPATRKLDCFVASLLAMTEIVFARHSGMVRRTRPGISRFRVRALRAPRNDGRRDLDQSPGLGDAAEVILGVAKGVLDHGQPL